MRELGGPFHLCTKHREGGVGGTAQELVLEQALSRHARN